MRRTQAVKNFKRVVSSLDGSASPEFPSMASNFRISGSKLAFRYGLSEVVASPVSVGQTYKCHALGFVQNTSGSAELLSVENRNGTIRPYTINKTTLARTQIGTDTVSDTPWVISSYADNAYFINPGGTATVYRHVIADNASFVKLADTGYTPPAESAALTATVQPYGSRRNIVGTDTFAISSGNLVSSGSTATFATSSGILTISSDSLDNGRNHRSLITIGFGATEDWSTRGYIGVEVLAGNIFKAPDSNTFEVTNAIPQVQTGGVWRDCEFKEFIQPDKVFIAVRIKGVTGTNAVQGIRFTVGGYVEDYGPGTACIVNPLKLGGQYLEAVASGDRLWDFDSTATGIDGIIYAARFTQAAGGSPQSATVQQSINEDGAAGSLLVGYNTRLGGRTSLAVAAANTGSYTHVQFLRLMQNGTTWKELAVVLNTSGTSPSFIDTYEENELSALTTITLTGVDPVEPEPPFSTDAIVGAFPFKQFMIWLKNTGVSNVQMSRVGNAEELYSDEATYDADDLTQPAQRTLADNADDIPVWGTQAGDVAFIVGSKAAYVLSGNYPVDMSPSRQIAGSRGIIGRYAGVRFRPKNGQYAAAYCDPDFNIWVIASAPQFEGDGRVAPIELSLPVRGKIREYLFTQQKFENPSLDVAKTQLEFDEQTSSLWVILGHRAAIFRQDMNGDGWEFHEYSLRTPDGQTTSSACTPFFGNGAVATSVPSGDAAWSDVGLPFDSDNAYCVSGSLGFGTLRTTETLRLDGYIPTTLIPVSATIDSVKVKVERKKTGDLTVTETTVQPRNGGSSIGSDLDTAYELTTTDAEQTFTLASLPTVAQINAGGIGLDLKYTQETWLTDWNDPANWTITVSDGGTAATMTVTATYIGGGTVPTRVYVNVTSATTTTVTAGGGGPTSLDYTGLATADNGLGAVVTGGVWTSGLGAPGDPDTNSFVTDSSTERKVISLTAGTGTTVINRAGSGSLYTGSGWTFVPSYTGSATLVTPTASAVQVDAARYEVCYTVTTSASAPSWIGWDQTCFTYDGRFVGVRSVGNTDLIEWDFRANAYIEGTARDAGYVPPVADYVSQDFSFEGVTARFVGVQVHTAELTDAPTVYSKITGGSFVSGFSTGYSTSRWWRFPIGQRSINHVFKLTLPETSGGVEGLAFEFEPTSRSKVR